MCVEFGCLCKKQSQLKTLRFFFLLICSLENSRILFNPFVHEEKLLYDELLLPGGTWPQWFSLCSKFQYDVYDARADFCFGYWTFLKLVAEWTFPFVTLSLFFLCNLRVRPLELAKQKCVCFGLCADDAETETKTEDKGEEGPMCGLCAFKQRFSNWPINTRKGFNGGIYF